MSDFVVREKLKQYGITEEPKGCMVCCVQVPIESKATMEYRQSYEFDYRILNDFCLQTTIMLFRAFRDAGFISIKYIEENISSM